MDDLINKYRCSRCELSWTLLAPSPAPAECSGCGHGLCMPYETRPISRATYVWRCWTCAMRWEGELHDCECGTPQDRIDLLSVHFECGEAITPRPPENGSQPSALGSA